MVHVTIHGPAWFIGVDAILEVIGGIVALLIVLATVRYMRLSKERGFAPLGTGFFFIFLSFLSEIIGLGLVWKELYTFQNALETVSAISAIVWSSHALHILFFTAGLLVLAIWALRIKDNLHRALLAALVIIIAITSIFNPMLHNILSLLLLMFICARFFTNAQCQGITCAWQVLAGFFLITLAQFAWVLEPLSPEWYVGGHAAQLAGYFLLLIVLVNVSRK